MGGVQNAEFLLDNSGCCRKPTHKSMVYDQYECYNPYLLVEVSNVIGR